MYCGKGVKVLVFFLNLPTFGLKYSLVHWSLNSRYEWITVDLLVSQLEFVVMIVLDVSLCQGNLWKHESQQNWRAVCLLTGLEQVLTQELLQVWEGFIAHKYEWGTDYACWLCWLSLREAVSFLMFWKYGSCSVLCYCISCCCTKH